MVYDCTKPHYILNFVLAVFFDRHIHWFKHLVTSVPDFGVCDRCGVTYNATREQLRKVSTEYAVMANELK